MSRNYIEILKEVKNIKDYIHRTIRDHPIVEGDFQKGCMVVLNEIRLMFREINFDWDII